MARSLTTDEWMSTIDFLTRTGQACTPLRQEFILLSDVLGVSALVDSLNNPPIKKATESSVLGPFFTEDAPDGSFFDLTYLSQMRINPTTCTVPLGESIASEGKGEYMFVEGRVLTSKGEPIPGAVIETWETDEKGEQHLDAFFLFSLMVSRRMFQPVPQSLRLLRYSIHGTLRTGLSW